MLTCPCNVDPLTPHFYIVKLGFTGVYNFFLIFALKHRLCVPLTKNKKKTKINSSENSSFYSREILQDITWACYRNFYNCYC